MWLWTSDPAADAAEAGLCWQAFLRRFDIEHTFRFLKQVLGWDLHDLMDRISKHNQQDPQDEPPPQAA